MNWGLGVLTWNDPASCASTLALLRQGVVGEYDLVVLDNGSDVPFRDEAATVIREPRNLGAGGGFSKLIAALLDRGADRLIVLEDDWHLRAALSLAIVDRLLSDHGIYQVRLGVRSQRPSEKYLTYGLDGGEAQRAAAQAETAPYVTYEDGLYQRLHILWSNNPFACRRAIAGHLLDGLDELALARKLWPLGWAVASTTPGYFTHAGAVKDRRGRQGWTR